MIFKILLVVEKNGTSWKLALDNIKEYAKKAYAGVVHNAHLVGHTPAEEEKEGDYVRLRLFKPGDKNVKFTGNSTKSARDNFFLNCECSYEGIKSARFLH